MAKWQKGQSGNPGGRPREVSDLRELARDHTEGAIRTIISVMNDSNATASARIAAAVALLDRGYGKPVQQVNQNTSLTLEQLITSSYESPLV